MKIIINVGVSGSGKSTWSTNYIKQNPRTVRINRDDLRKTLKGTLDGYYQIQKGLLNANENLINKLEEYMLTQAFLSNFDVIIDNTNLKPSYITRWLDFIFYLAEGEETQPEIWFKLFPEDNAHTLKQRVNLRDVPPSWEALNYIDHQVKNLEFMKRYLEINHPKQLING